MQWTERLRPRQLRLLDVLAQTHNLSHAAERLHTTQPALSKQLKELEDAVGLPLFARHARGLRPTAYGEALLVHARHILAQLDRAGADMAALRAGSAGRVVLGASGAAVSDTAPRAMLALLARMPQAQVRLVEGTMDQLVGQLLQGTLDVVVGRSAPELHEPGLQTETLYSEPLNFVARPGHALVEAEPDWPGVLACRWIVWPRGTPIRETLEAALAAAGQRLPEDCLESNSLSANLALLADSNMIGTASHRAARRFEQAGALRILALTLHSAGSVSMMWRQDVGQPLALQNMLSCLREVAAAG